MIKKKLLGYSVLEQKHVEKTRHRFTLRTFSLKYKKVYLQLSSVFASSQSTPKNIKTPFIYLLQRARILLRRELRRENTRIQKFKNPKDVK